VCVQDGELNGEREFLFAALGKYGLLKSIVSSRFTCVYGLTV